MKPKVYITRHLPEEARTELIESCDVDIWDHEVPPPYETIAEKVRNMDGLLCLLTDRIDAALIESAARLKVISQVAVGYDNIDVAAATRRGIQVGNTPGVLTDATADFTFTLLMAAARRVGEAIDHVRAGKWETWGLTLLLGRDVYGATLGIVGFGRIGQAVARRARGFDMKILFYDTDRHLDEAAEMGAQYRSLQNLLQDSDFVTLHASLNDGTHSLIDARALSLMKPTSILINTARGPIVDTDALYHTLKTGQIAYAALDVTDPEPLPADHKLLTLPNLIVVPHIASATVTSRTQMALMAVRNVVAGVRGEPLPFPVNKV